MTLLNSITKKWCDGLVLGLALILMSLPTSVRANVEPGSGEYHHTMDDIIVKVMGGYVRAQHTWYKREWHFNRAWNPLKIVYDNNNGEIISVDRNGDIYKKPSTGNVFTLAHDKRKTLTKTTDGYRWQDREGNWIDYDEQGQVIKYGDRNNVTVTLMYDTENRRIGVQDHFGVQVLWYEHDADGKIISVRDHVDPAEARQVEYHYTSDQLTSMTDVLGKTWTYTYTRELLTRITDPDGRITEVTYDNAGRVSSSGALNGTSTSYKLSYDKTRKEFFASRLSSNGRSLGLRFNRAGQLINRSLNGANVGKIEISGRQKIITNELGHKTIREYDEWENLTKITYPDNTSVSYKYDSKYSNILEVIDERGIVTKYDYDDNGNLIRETEAVGKPDVSHG